MTRREPRPTPERPPTPRGRLPILVFATVALNAIGALAGGNGPDPTATVPKLVIERSEVDVGAQLYNRELWSVFDVRNDGNAPLTLAIVKKSCGCTASMVSHPEVAPGGTAQIKVGYVPKQEAPRRGPNAFTVELATNDLAMPTMVLTVSVNLVERVFAEPNELDFGEVVPGQSPVRELTIQAIDGPEHAPDLRIRPKEDWIRLQPQSVVRRDDRRFYPNSVALDTTRLSGRIRGTVIVESDFPEVPVIEVPVTATIETPFRASPASVKFGAAAPGQRLVRTAELSPRYGSAGPASVSCDSEAVRCTLSRHDSTAGWTITFALDAPSVSQMKRIAAKAKVLDANGALLCEVPVSAVVKPQP